MKQIINIVLIIITSISSQAFSTQVQYSQVQLNEIKFNQIHKINKEEVMSAKGIFEINLTPQQDENPSGRLLIDKTYSGDLTGTG
ncbi:MAG: hypothetical protein P8I03_08345, partial [Thalassotalea sp.]|nr:hypothetical protein [Thalassotalea sp.]